MGVQQRPGGAAGEGCGPEVRHCLLHLVTGGRVRIGQQLILNFASPGSTGENLLPGTNERRMSGNQVELDPHKANLICSGWLLTDKLQSLLSHFFCSLYLLWLMSTKNNTIKKKKKKNLQDCLNVLPIHRHLFLTRYSWGKKFKPTLLLQVNIDLYAMWYMTKQTWCHIYCVEDVMRSCLLGL